MDVILIIFRASEIAEKSKTVSSSQTSMPPKQRKGKSSGSNNAAQPSDAAMTYVQHGSTGLTVGPTSVLVMSVMFIGSVILLHMWAKIM